MKISLIITTYNWVEALELSLRSALKQSKLPDEIIIADDGSTITTKNLVNKFTKNSKIKIIHSWQEDKGFRLAKSRNLAIKKTSTDYIICIDGDMILDKNFIKDHINIAKKGCYAQGSRVLLNNKLTQNTLKYGFLKIPSLFSKKTKNNLNGLKSNILAKIISKQENQNLKGIKGCNFAFFKNDFLKVNGFNEKFITWGREDSEFIIRLYNIGIKRKNLKFNGIQYHLFHNENNSNSKNDAILQKTIKEKLVWCKNGININIFELK